MCHGTATVTVSHFSELKLRDVSDELFPRFHSALSRSRVIIISSYYRESVACGLRPIVIQVCASRDNERCTLYAPLFTVVAAQLFTSPIVGDCMRARRIFHWGKLFSIRARVSLMRQGSTRGFNFTIVLKSTPLVIDFIQFDAKPDIPGYVFLDYS